MTDESGETIDDPIVVISADGHAVDFNLHGGPWVVRATFDLARRFGFEVIDRLEAPLPVEAVDGKNEIEQDVLRYLPLARTELATRALLAQIQAWRGIDRQALTRERCDDLAADWSLYWLLHLPRVAIVGPANVGKSTLANQLFATERSITADMPGTTRDWVGEIANLDGLAVMLIDTPGIRETGDAIEAEAIHRAAAPIGRADLVVLVLDLTRPLEGEQATLVARFPCALFVLNKSDRPQMFQLPGVQTVATTGEGVDALRRAIRERFGVAEPYNVHQPRLWTEEIYSRMLSDRHE